MILMTIIEDTRQKPGEHTIKADGFNERGILVIRCKLPFGDYANVPTVAVDTKRDMDEIAGNIGSDHRRFAAECKAAQEAGCKLYFLIENRYGIRTVDDVHLWVNPRLIYSPKAITGDRLERAMKTMQERYGCVFLFCEPEQAAGIIQTLLERG